MERWIGRSARPTITPALPHCNIAILWRCLFFVMVRVPSNNLLISIVFSIGLRASCGAIVGP
jgi:hypothetical protein